MTAQLLFMLGSGIFGVLGAVHLVFTFFTNKLDPRDTHAKSAMAQTPLRLSRHTTVWRAWIGFNASHSLGGLFVAAFYIPMAHSHFTVIDSSVWFAGLPTMIGISYLLLAKHYWFNAPLLGILLATLCFICGFALTHIL